MFLIIPAHITAQLEQQGFDVADQVLKGKVSTILTSADVKYLRDLHWLLHWKFVGSDNHIHIRKAMKFMNDYPELRTLPYPCIEEGMPFNPFALLNDVGSQSAERFFKSTRNMIEEDLILPYDSAKQIGRYATVEKAPYGTAPLYVVVLRHTHSDDALDLSTCGFKKVFNHIIENESSLSVYFPGFVQYCMKLHS